MPVAGSVLTLIITIITHVCFPLILKWVLRIEISADPSTFRQRQPFDFVQFQDSDLKRRNIVRSYKNKDVTVCLICINIIYFSMMFYY